MYYEWYPCTEMLHVAMARDENSIYLHYCIIMPSTNDHCNQGSLTGFHQLLKYLKYYYAVINCLFDIHVLVLSISIVLKLSPLSLMRNVAIKVQNAPKTLIPTINSIPIIYIIYIYIEREGGDLIFSFFFLCQSHSYTPVIQFYIHTLQ